MKFSFVIDQNGMLAVYCAFQTNHIDSVCKLLSPHVVYTLQKEESVPSEMTREYMQQLVANGTYKQIDTHTFVNQEQGSIVFDAYDKASFRKTVPVYCLRLSHLDSIKKMLHIRSDLFTSSDLLDEEVRNLPKLWEMNTVSYHRYPSRKDITYVSTHTAEGFVDFLKKMALNQKKIPREIINKLNDYTGITYKKHSDSKPFEAFKDIDFSMRSLKEYLPRMDKKHLAYFWLANRYGWYFEVAYFNRQYRNLEKQVKFASLINAFDFVEAYFDLTNGFEGVRTDIMLKEGVNRYIRERRQFIRAALQTNFWKTLRSCLRHPFSMDSFLEQRKELIAQSHYELAFIDEFERFKSSFKVNTHDKLHQFATRLNEEGKTAFAAIFFSHVRPDQKEYSVAMAEAMCAYRYVGDYENASYYSELADDATYCPLFPAVPKEPKKMDNKEAKNNITFAHLSHLLKQINPGNSKGILEMKATLERYENPVEALFYIQKLARERLKPGFKTWYSYSSFFGKGRDSGMATLYFQLASLQFDKKNHQKHLGEVIDCMENLLQPKTTASPLI
ncbi:MAG: hypothetical protein WC785_09265 [Tatlockia sp.]|jgi:hypothetical protein